MLRATNGVNRKLSPSEEALALHILKNPKTFAGKRVLDVGAGLGFAGFVCAVCTHPAYLQLTDGDAEVCRTLEASFKLNEDKFGDTRVEIKKTLWDMRTEWAERHTFDVVVAADVVYLEQFHSALLAMLAHVLRPGGLFILIASKRNGSLDKFISIAKSTLTSLKVCDDYDQDVSKAIKRSAKCFPIMVRATALVEAELPTNIVQMCEAQREQRQRQQQQAEQEAKQQELERQKRKAYTEELLNRRKRRLQEEAEDAAEAAIAAAAAAAAEAAQAAAVQPRVRMQDHADSEGKSDWRLFERKCAFNNDGQVKEMVFDCNGSSVTIRKPVKGEFFHGDFARKISPSEEALAKYVIKRRKRFKKRHILELGAGVGFAGIVACVFTSAKCVDLTDGDANCVAMLQENIALNRESFKAKKVSAKQLLWGEAECKKRFDYILAADVVYLESSHTALLSTLRRFLKPNGTVIMFASPRCGSLDAFIKEASVYFDRVENTRNYDAEVTTALHGMKCFPHMVRLRRTAARLPQAMRSQQACVRANSAPDVQPASRLRDLTPHGGGQTERPAAGALQSRRRSMSASIRRPPRLPPPQEGGSSPAEAASKSLEQISEPSTCVGSVSPVPIGARGSNQILEADEPIDLSADEGEELAEQGLEQSEEEDGNSEDDDLEEPGLDSAGGFAEADMSAPCMQQFEQNLRQDAGGASVSCGSTVAANRVGSVADVDVPSAATLESRRGQPRLMRNSRSLVPTMAATCSRSTSLEQPRPHESANYVDNNPLVMQGLGVYGRAVGAGAPPPLPVASPPRRGCRNGSLPARLVRDSLAAVAQKDVGDLHEGISDGYLRNARVRAAAVGGFDYVSIPVCFPLVPSKANPRHLSVSRLKALPRGPRNVDVPQSGAGLAVC